MIDVQPDGRSGPHAGARARADGCLRCWKRAGERVTLTFFGQIVVERIRLCPGCYASLLDKEWVEAGDTIL